MDAFVYIYKRTFFNKVKKAFKKPVTIIYTVGIIAYGVFMISFMGNCIHSMNLNSDRGLVGVLTIFVLINMPSSIVILIRRKGLLFKPSDVHFVFPAPFNPKIILLYAHVKGVLMEFVLVFFMSIAGVVWFGMPIWKMLLYFTVANIFQNILEASMVVLLYGNEKIPEKTMKKIPWFLYAFILGIGIYLIIALLNQGFSMETALNALFMKELQWIPIVGWNIAMFHFLFIGPTVTNVICTSLYFLSVILLLWLAIRMKCTGKYFEQAMKFAEDYQEARSIAKKGGIGFVGKKKKYKQAQISYKGDYAKAIFYRQILEYKKNRFFIFGFGTIVNVIITIAIVVGAITFQESLLEIKAFILPGIMAYIALIFSGFTGKWAKELENPYTFLIPDTAFKKLWYATLMEHIRSFIDGSLLTIPAGIALRLSPIQILLTIGIYVCIQANKLYLVVLVEGWLGNLLGNTAKQLLKTFIFCSILALGVGVAFVGSLVFGINTGFILMIVVMSVFTLGCMFVAASIFERMEVE